MPFVSEIEVVFFTGTMKRNRTINEKDRFVNIVFVADFREKTDLRERYFLSVQALCVANHLFQDRRQRTANIADHQAESQFHQPQRDSGSDQLPAVDRPCEPSYELWIVPDQHRTPQETKQYSKAIIQTDEAEY
jgi:hypothetical protein